MEIIIGNIEQRPGGDFETTRPLVSPAFAAAVLDCSRYHLLERIENQELPLAFNIAAPGVVRICLRVASANVRAVRSGLKPSSDLVKFLESTFPSGEPFYAPPRLAWLLDCDYDHIYHLVGAKVLADVGKETRYLIPRRSIFEFLTKRRLA